jgi:hypothetical protein
VNRRAYGAALVILGAGYVVLTLGALGHAPIVVLLSAAVLFVVDDLLTRIEPPAVLSRLQQVGADTLWRSAGRKTLVVLFLVRSGELSHTAANVVVMAVIAQHLAICLNRGVDLLITRRRTRRVEVRNLPVPGSELPPPPPEWLLRHGERLQNVGELLLFGALGYGWASGSYSLIAPAAVAMFVVAIVRPLLSVPQLFRLLRLPGNAARLAAAQAAVLEHRPLVILHFSGAPTAVYQVNMWLETMERLERPGLVLLREREYWDELPITSVPLLCLPSSIDVMNFDFGEARAALYVANVGRNIHLLRLPTLKSAFIGHGDSDKVASFNPFAKVYDEVWVAGEAGRQRYLRANVGVRPEEIVLVGRPQLDGIQTTTDRASDRPFSVLYAPTWEGWVDDPHGSSLEVLGREIVRRLLGTDGVCVVYKPHPLTGTVRATTRKAHSDIVAMIRAAGTPHEVVLDAEKSLYACFDGSDALISDISSVVPDYLRTEKPYFVTNGADVPESGFREQNPSAGAAYLIGSDCAGLDQGLAAARGDDPMRAARHAVREYLLGDPNVPGIILFRKAVDDLAARAAGAAGWRDDHDELLQQQADLAVVSAADRGGGRDAP